MKRKQLILHADDLGIARDVNRAGFEALENGWITSASVMVPAAHFAEVASFARKHDNRFDLGIHLTFTSEWKRNRLGPCADRKKVKSLLDKDGFFHSSVEKFVAHALPEEIVLEAQTQIQVALESGIKPSHLDCHMFALYGQAKLRSLMSSLAMLYDLPFVFPDRNIFWINAETAPLDWPKAYIEMILKLPTGLSQIIVHLGYDTEALSKLMGRHALYGSAWRQRDLEFFGSYFLLGFLKKQSIQLTNWKLLRQETLS